MFLIKVTNENPKNPWQFIPFAKRCPSGTQAAQTATWAATSGTHAVASGTLAAISGQPSRIICPIGRAKKHNLLYLLQISIFCLLVPGGTILFTLNNWKIKALH
jgi:hypothetical protein